LINAETMPGPDGDDAAVEAIVATGAGGAAMLAGLSTAAVIGLWIAFYLLVFVPRSTP
jgi:hypothetical protein